MNVILKGGQRPTESRAEAFLGTGFFIFFSANWILCHFMTHFLCIFGNVKGKNMVRKTTINSKTELDEIERCASIETIREKTHELSIAIQKALLDRGEMLSTADP